MGIFVAASEEIKTYILTENTLYLQSLGAYGMRLSRLTQWNCSSGGRGSTLKAAKIHLLGKPCTRKAMCARIRETAVGRGVPSLL